jgi:transposase
MTQIKNKEQEKLDFMGIDISKLKLDVCWKDNHKQVISNDSSGFKQLIKLLPSTNDIIIVMEASGGYEKLLIHALQDNNYKVVLANAFRVRKYAEALGFYAKNDPIDSYVIKSFGEDIYPKGKLNILMPKSPVLKELEMWLKRSRQLIKTLVSEKQRFEKAYEKEMKNDIRVSINFLQRRLIKTEEIIQTLSKDSQFVDKVQKYQTIQGIGSVCANALAIYLPELGHCSNKKISAIVGTAPYCKDSGKHKGVRRIKGGRSKLRSILYMGMLTATQHNTVIKEFYQRLKKKGKPHNVAIIACMRKLLCIINAMQRNNTLWDDKYSVNKN